MGVTFCLGVLTGQPRPTFEVAAVKRLDPSAPIRARMSTRGGPGTTDPTRFECRGCPLGLLIAKAYDVDLAQVLGPDWVLGDLFEMQANVPEQTSLQDFREMLRSLLVDRFQLKANREARESGGYELSVAPGALKLRESGPPVDQPQTSTPVEKRLDAAGFPILLPGESMAMSLQHYRRHAGETMADLARFLTLWLGKPVVDRTGLAGRYDTELTFVMPRVSRAQPDDAQDVPGPTLIDAVRENGLKLIARKVQVDFIVVESALRNPIAN